MPKDQKKNDELDMAKLDQVSGGARPPKKKDSTEANNMSSKLR